MQLNSSGLSSFSNLTLQISDNDIVDPSNGVNTDIANSNGDTPNVANPNDYNPNVAKSFISRNDNGIIFKQKTYSPGHSGEFIILLDAKNPTEIPSETHILTAMNKYAPNTPDIEIKKIGRRRYCLKVPNFEVYEITTNLSFLKQNFLISIPSNLSEYIGVVRVDTELDLVESAITSLGDTTRSEEINAIFYITRFAKNQRVRTNYARIHFANTRERQSLLLGCVSYHVSKYIPKIKACNLCHRYGHLGFTCRAQPRCRFCGITSSKHHCSSADLQCLACGGQGHVVGNRDCPLLKYLARFSLDIYHRVKHVRALIEDYFNENRQSWSSVAKGKPPRIPDSGLARHQFRHNNSHSPPRYRSERRQQDPASGHSQHNPNNTGTMFDSSFYHSALFDNYNLPLSPITPHTPSQPRLPIGSAHGDLESVGETPGTTNVSTYRRNSSLPTKNIRSPPTTNQNSSGKNSTSLHIEQTILSFVEQNSYQLSPDILQIIIATVTHTLSALKCNHDGQE